MYGILKKLEYQRTDSLHKLLNYNSRLYPEEKLEAYFRHFYNNQLRKKKLRYYVDPFDYGIPTAKLKKLSESTLTLIEIKQIINKCDIELASWLYKEVLTSFKVALRDSNIPIELYISDKNANLIFDVPITRLYLYRKSGLIRAVKKEDSYCYPWTQLQELFS